MAKSHKSLNVNDCHSAIPRLFVRAGFSAATVAVADPCAPQYAWASTAERGALALGALMGGQFDD